MPSLHNMVNPPSRSGRGAHPSVWRGIVVNITAAHVWVRIPTLANDDLTATNTVPGDLAPGDRVVIAAIEGRVDNLVVIAKENPSVPSHLHLEADISYPGWAVLTLTAGWTAATTPGYFSGLRYRTDGRFLHIHGTITGATAGAVTTLPTAPAYTSPLVGLDAANTPAPLTIDTTGVLTATVAGTLRINASAPLT